MNFDIKDLPYSSFEKLGMDRKDVLKMNPEDLAALLSGKRTSLNSHSINAEGLNMTVDARLSLQKNTDGSLSLLLHPVRKEIDNTIGLTKDEIGKLKSGEIITRPLTSLNGEREPYIIQLDRMTNEILKVREKDIVIPKSINGVELTNEQKEDLRRGKAIELTNGQDKKETIKLDLNEYKGYSINSSVSQSKEMSLSGVKR